MDIEHALGGPHLLIAVHTGDCWLLHHAKRMRAVDRDTARQALADGIEACGFCRPEHRTRHDRLTWHRPIGAEAGEVPVVTSLNPTGNRASSAETGPEVEAKGPHPATALPPSSETASAADTWTARLRLVP
ncbi:DUF6233 domain-containing protein [Streptomyces sp. NPDC005878]|uniref:DUF6233 domain-containing protein n=1 Tax=Streptomyces sp. NPDC005878 TaxID=3157077 RepID=UPI0033EA2F4F